ncbi:MAG: DUF120 domain-containing protein [Firmicutes bacterium]|nr:DUF120 domain-containing protein [Bacillota bacterium]
MTGVLLVRHGETDWNRNRRCQGTSDIQLNERGRWQAGMVAEALRGENLAAVYSSPLARARELAAAVAAFHGLEVHLSRDLEEMDHGGLEGLTFQQITACYPEVLRVWRTEPDRVRLPGGESLGDAQERGARFLTGIAAAPPSASILVVSHAFLLSTIMCSTLGLPLSCARRVQPDLASISRIGFRQGGGFFLDTFNNRHHLDPLEFRGSLVDGIGEGKRLTQIPWVRRQFMDKIGIDPYPGTINLAVESPGDLAMVRLMRSLPGITITPEEMGFCSAAAYPVLVAGKWRGAVIVPDVPSYPLSSVEIIAAERLRERLTSPGDGLITVRVLPPGDQGTP